MTEETITVCAACLRASCWHGEFYCDDASSAGLIEKTVTELNELKREHPHHYSAEKLREVYGR